MIIDIKNVKFTKLLVLEYVGNSFWECLCDCGNIKKVKSCNLRSEKTKSCGCLKKSLNHGMKELLEYKVFMSAKARCNNPNDEGYKNYGERGIQFKFNSFIELLNSIGKRPTKYHQLDRINNNGNYEIGNVRWVLPDIQNRNKRSNRLMTLNNETKTLVEWSELIKINKVTLSSRVNESGWCDYCALTIPSGKKYGRCSHINK